MWRIVAFTFRSLHIINSYSILSRLPIFFLVRGIIGRTRMGSIIESQRPLVTGPDALVETKFLRIYLDLSQDPTNVASENFTTLLPNRLCNYYYLINEEKQCYNLKESLNSQNFDCIWNLIKYFPKSPQPRYTVSSHEDIRVLSSVWSAIILRQAVTAMSACADDINCISWYKTASQLFILTNYTSHPLKS